MTVGIVRRVVEVSGRGIRGRQGAVGPAGSASASSKLTTVAIDPGGPTEGSQVTREMELPAAQDSGGFDNNYMLRAIVTKVEFHTGPPPRDDFFTFSHFLAASNVSENSADLEDDTLPGLALVIENPFWEHGSWLSEFQVRGYSKIAAGGTHQRRPIMSGCAHLAETRGAANWIGFEVDRVLFNDAGQPGTPSVTVGYFDTQNRIFDLFFGAILRGMVNGVPLIGQRNAADTATVTFGLTANDAWLTGAFEMNGLPKANTATGAISLLHLINQHATPSDPTLLLRGINTGATVYAGQMDFSASAFLIQEIKNRHATGNLVLELKTTAGQVLVTYGRSGKEWTAGADTDDNWKLSASNNDLAAPAVTVRRSDKVTILGAPVKLPSYTVAGLPSAATCGAGAKAWASNGRKPGEAAGAGTGLEVVSDGAAWVVPAGGWGEIASWAYSSGVASVPFTNLGDYRQIRVEVWGISHGDAADQLPIVQLSTNNGSSYLSGSYSNTHTNATAGLALHNATITAAKIWAGVMDLFDFNLASRQTHMATNGGMVGENSGIYNGVGQEATAAAHNALRVLWHGGVNFDAGTRIVVYGYRLPHAAVLA